MMTPRIDEQSRRRAAWTDGYPAGLADGQTWTFPRIALRVMRPRRAESGFFAAGEYHANGTGLPDFDRWYAVVAGTAPVTGYDYLNPRLTAAATLLSLNYDLSDDEIGELLPWEPEDPSGPCAAMWEEIDRAIRGEVPKPSPAISDSPASSAE